MANMEYIEIPYVKKKVSRILYGTAMPPFMTGGNGSQLFDAMYRLGVTTFDTAREYMEAELSLGRWIEERDLRDRVVILSKCGHPSISGRKRINKENKRRLPNVRKNI